ncbi:unnamed protein product [Adineta steineri]|uniref:Secretory carrier-associated membrane protein n=2 Tax=Adineta steineri TaxID=433720 RepID=A0A813YKG3_9BILA|nr:unnamed protein product [Adineta steineri]CAF3820582.1 unnamed protein product [Adineta steineri]
MNIDEDINPFADPSIQQATQQTFTNQQTLNDYNPFGNTTVGSKVQLIEPTQINATPSLPATQQPPVYASATIPNTIPQTTRIDLTQLERQQAELEQREKRLMERERELRNSQVAHRDKNFPPLPAWFPLRPCFYQDINVEIPPEFQIWVRYLYYLWLLYAGTLALNIIAAFAYLMVDKNGVSTFGLSIVYFILFIPCSGFILMVKLFSSHVGSKIIVGLIVMIVTLSFGFIVLADALLLIKVHRLYRQSGATLEQAQREFQSAFVNNPTVRGAAREAATAGINETLRSSSYK